MHVLHVFFLNNNLTNYLYFYNKILFNFKYIYAFAWSYMLVTSKGRITQPKKKKSYYNRQLLFNFISTLANVCIPPILYVIWVLNSSIRKALWGPKSEVPAHFVFKAQSPGRGALLPRTYDESPSKASECGRGRSHAQHLTKRLKKRTNSVQEQYKGKSCQYRNVEPCV